MYKTRKYSATEQLQWNIDSNGFLRCFHSWNRYMCDFWFYGDSKRTGMFYKYTLSRNYQITLFFKSLAFPQFLRYLHVWKKSLFLYLQFATNRMSIFKKMRPWEVVENGSLIRDILYITIQGVSIQWPLFNKLSRIFTRYGHSVCCKL